MLQEGVELELHRCGFLEDGDLGWGGGGFRAFFLCIKGREINSFVRFCCVSILPSLENS